MYHIFFIHSSVNGYLGCFYVLAPSFFLLGYSCGPRSPLGGSEWERGTSETIDMNLREVNWPPPLSHPLLSRADSPLQTAPTRAHFFSSSPLRTPSPGPCQFSKVTLKQPPLVSWTLILLPTNCSPPKAHVRPPECHLLPSMPPLACVCKMCTFSCGPQGPVPLLPHLISHPSHFPALLQVHRNASSFSKGPHTSSKL